MLGHAASPTTGLVMWDFVLDRKGSDEVKAKLTFAHQQRGRGELGSYSVPVMVGEEVLSLAFSSGDNLGAAATAFALRHGLDTGGSCEDARRGTGCVAGVLLAAMEAEMARAEEEAPPWATLPGRYEGCVEAELVSGRIDVGAFAFPTTIGRAIGYRWRHHSADWAFAEALHQELVQRRGLEVAHIRQTLYVHN